MAEVEIRACDREVDGEAHEIVRRGLDATVPASLSAWDARPLSLVARSPDRVVGVVLGQIVWDWYEIQALWVDDEWRGRGFGRRLLTRAEEEALARSCRYVRLDTTSFQAPGFYRKCGYRQWGELPDFPRGHTRHWLVKWLVADPHDAYRRLPRVSLELGTERLWLRQFSEDDLDDVARLNADPDFARFVGGVKNRADSWRQLAMLIGHWQMRGYGWYAVTLKGDDRVIGRVGHWFPEGWPELEVGWALDPAHWGRGYATEGARACLALARDSLGLSRVISLIHPDNQASRRVAERLGGTRERLFDLAGEQVEIWRTPTS